MEIEPVLFRDLPATLGREFIIPDIHGCIKTIHKALSLINIDPHDRIIFLGDYIHKGPDSQGVLNLCIQLSQQLSDIYFLRGNHEQLFLDGFGQFDAGEDTVRYQNFLNKTLHFIRTPSHYFVHAGFDFSQLAWTVDTVAMMNMVGFEYHPTKAGSRDIIHGHSPRSIDKLTGDLLENKKIIGLDTGCVYPERTGHGVLSILETKTGNLIPVRNCED